MAHLSDSSDSAASISMAEPDRPSLYSVPRRFDIATLLAVTLAYALLFTVMRLSRFEPVTFALVAGFFTAVGLGQALLFRGRTPRRSSALVGAAFYMLLYSLGAGWSPCFSTTTLIGGGVAGYVAGTLVAGVFLVADRMRRATARPRQPE